MKTSALFRCVALAGVAWCLSGAAARAQAPPASWVRGGQWTSQAREMIGALRDVEKFGLAPADFSVALATIDSLDARAEPSRLDAALTAPVRLLVAQLHDGRVDARAAGYALERRRAPLDLDAAVRSLAASAHPLETLASFEPRAAQYHALEGALARYRLIRTDLTSLPPTRLLRPGMEYAGAEKLRWLLAELGDGAAPRDDGAAESHYDAELSGAVANFQRRHGLQDDGVLGARTFAALTVPIARRVRQIELTLERWRWLPDFQPPAVIVNVPQYMLYALTDAPTPGGQAAALRIPVIVGQTARQTPIFDSTIQSIVFRPYWDVPESIAREELLPLIDSEPGYLERHEMEIVRGAGNDARVLGTDADAVAALRAGRARVRQRPGRQNALGLIKFVLPNPYDVYLHSTPDAALFARDQRTLSHGCIRVSDAGALAAYLLTGTPGDWTPDAIEAATCGDRTFAVRLARPVPVFILYGTVVVDVDGRVLFFDDVYGYDQRLDDLLRASQSKTTPEMSAEMHVPFLPARISAASSSAPM